jgi:hypothetical protein
MYYYKLGINVLISTGKNFAYINLIKVLVFLR